MNDIRVSDSYQISSLSERANIWIMDVQSPLPSLPVLAGGRTRGLVDMSRSSGFVLRCIQECSNDKVSCSSIAATYDEIASLHVVHVSLLCAFQLYVAEAVAP